MKKFAPFLVLGAVLAVGLPDQAMAADVATVVCAINSLPNGTYTQTVFLSQASAGVTLPPSCAVTSTSSCSQCLADVLSTGFELADSFGNPQPYFVFKRAQDHD